MTVGDDPRFHQLVDDLTDDLVRAALRCERAARAFEAADIQAAREGLQAAINAAGLAWSGSWIGYQACVYTADLQPRRPGESFDSDWGADGGFNDTTRGRWAEYDPAAVVEEITRRARQTGADLGPIEELALRAKKAFDESIDDVLPTVDAIVAMVDDPNIRERREKLSKLRSHFLARDFIEHARPNQIATHDSRAFQQGVIVPPHLRVQARLLEQLSYGTCAAELASHVRYLVKYLQKRHKMTGKSIGRTDGNIYIGHGRAAAWRDLKDFLQDRLGLRWDEFNREAAAGKSTKERLAEMLDAASFAFLVMTAEDEHADASVHARANVVHEVGLFQGRLGFERAIVLLEEGCAEFSNIAGLTQIRFPKGNIKAVSEEIRRVLEREGILK